MSELFYEGLKHQLEDAFGYKKNGQWQCISHIELQARVESLALAFGLHGLKKGDRVGILSENRPEWAIVDFACALCGLVSVPIYHTLSPEQVKFILKDSACTWLCVSSCQILKKHQESIQQLSGLENLLIFDPSEEGQKCERKRIFTWDRIMHDGEALSGQRIEIRKRLIDQSPDDLLTLIYTSGTTGDPKGVMLTHGNLASNVFHTLEMELESIQPARGDRALSVLPLSHVFERMAGHYTLFYLGVSIYYAESLLALQQNLLEIQPHILAAVPRIFEKIYLKVRDAAMGDNALSHLIFKMAQSTCHRVVRHLYLDRRPPIHLRIPWQWADRLLLSKVREKTGGRLRFAISGGAPLDPTVMEFFWAMGLPIYEGYGLTETSPVITVTRRGRVKPGHVGSAILKSHLDKPFLKFAPDGEILVCGPNVMKGYWNNEAATREVFDEEGYFHTGDIGTIDPQGRVKITDRKKELIITSGGKKVAPQPIENLLRMDPAIHQAMLLGDGQDHISALVVPNLTFLKRHAKKNKLKFKDDSEMLQNERIRKLIQSRIEKINQKLSNFERVRKFELIAEEMTQENGQLTPSLKIKRRIVRAAHPEAIQKLYEK